MDWLSIDIILIVYICRKSILRSFSNARAPMLPIHISSRRFHRSREALVSGFVAKVRCRGV